MQLAARCYQSQYFKERKQITTATDKYNSRYGCYQSQYFKERKQITTVISKLLFLYSCYQSQYFKERKQITTGVLINSDLLSFFAVNGLPNRHVLVIKQPVKNI